MVLVPVVSVSDKCLDAPPRVGAVPPDPVCDLESGCEVVPGEDSSRVFLSKLPH